MVPQCSHSRKKHQLPPRSFHFPRPVLLASLTHITVFHQSKDTSDCKYIISSVVAFLRKRKQSTMCVNDTLIVRHFLLSEMSKCKEKNCLQENEPNLSWPLGRCPSRASFNVVPEGHLPQSLSLIPTAL